MKLARFLAAAVLGAGLFAGGAAVAEPPECPPWQVNRGWCSSPEDPGWTARRWRDTDRAAERAYEDGYRDGLREAHRRGDRLSRDRYRVGRDYDRFGSPYAGEGYAYGQVDERSYMMDRAAGIILDALRR